MSGFSFVCRCCGDAHDGLPDIGFTAPYFWDEMDAAARPADNKLNSDFCVVGGEHYFIRCVLDVPVRGTDAVLGWGVWVSQSKSNYELYGEAFDATPGRVTFGYLANRLPNYPDTLNMPTQVHWQTDGNRPLVELDESDHPLYRDWVDGITRERAIDFAMLTLHPDN